MAYANGIDFGPYSEAGVMRDVFVFTPVAVKRTEAILKVFGLTATA